MVPLLLREYRAGQGFDLAEGCPGSLATLPSGIK